MKHWMKSWIGVLFVAVGLASSLVAQEVQMATVRVTMEPAAELFLNHKKVAEGDAHQLTLTPGQPALLKVMKRFSVSSSA